MNMTIGRYLPLNSWMHKRDPRIKLISMIILIVAVFIDIGFLGYGIIGAFLIVALLVSKVSFKMILKSMRAMLFMMVFLLIINTFVVKTGALWINFGFIKIYEGAILQTLYIFIRLVIMISITTILTVSTKPMDLTMAIEDLLGPLKVIKVPAHEIAMIISIALRFIPTLIDEANRIMKAQASRGVDFDEGSLKEKISSILALIIPLFASSFQRAEELADAMEARGYVPGEERTRYRVFKINSQDIMLLLISISLLVGFIIKAYF
ncbi:MAG TPA: energy-coupling factor transporter transmembrane component T [Erysipelotrichaceae bacterium]|nr:energy-coupling factor transporter transmembrane component T [Erysipelotrichaceae bacterium]